MGSRDTTSVGESSVNYQTLEFTYQASQDQTAPTPVRHPVVIVGAGPVGLSLAIDMAQRGVKVLLLDNDHKLSSGSRAICFAKRTLEIFDRLGPGERMVRKGVSWNVGRVYFKDEPVYSFNLLPDVAPASATQTEPTQARPAFINLQQYYVEGYLIERALELPLIDIRWCNTVTGLNRHSDHTELNIDTPDGAYTVHADYMVACDGSRSPLRAMMGLETEGRVFRDRFLIADVRMDVSLPEERRFWFDPPFHPKQSVLLHKQADSMWRIDFQLGWDADPEAEKQPERIAPRVRALLDSMGAADVGFTIGWASVYTFACQRMQSFRHSRVLFAGDAAHGVSPFGARGANSGVQDADNLGWKLARVVQGKSPASLLDSYAFEREYAADENILNSTRATDFITPKSEVSALFRDAVLALSRRYPFARRVVNSGRLSVPSTLIGSALNTADVDEFSGSMVPGAPALDAPLVWAGRRTWLLRELGADFTLLVFGTAPDWAANLKLKVLAIESGVDTSCHAKQRYDARPGTVYLLRPDQHVCARWRTPTHAAVQNAIAKATAC
ncbi:MAG: FAD-dependent oxidoreductase [Pseudorhodobacter sp.]|nr:FAD-dependent oxidoreductase [Rhizobacter sp.]